MLTGVVRDAKTNEFIIGENIIIKELQQGTITDEEGKYSIRIPYGKYTIVFSSLNYNTLEKQVNCNKDIVILNAVL